LAHSVVLWEAGCHGGGELFYCMIAANRNNTDAMSDNTSAERPRKKKKRRSGAFQRAVLRGLGVVLPLLLTIVIFIWMWNTVKQFVLRPAEIGVREVLCWTLADVYDEMPSDARPAERDVDEPGSVVMVTPNDTYYMQVASGQWIPEHVYRHVLKDPGPEMPKTPKAFYRRYITTRYLPPSFVIPVFLCVLILILYLLGKFMAARMGRMIWQSVDLSIQSVPFIRTVYGSVKQVTDFVFTEQQELEFTRVVAVEYPRKGIWSLGFVTGQSMIDLRTVADEDVISVLMPTSPMPATGFTITVRKSETVNLNLTLEEAFQFIVSCGVVVPADQLQPNLTDTENRRLAADRTGSRRMGQA